MVGSGSKFLFIGIVMLLSLTFFPARSWTQTIELFGRDLSQAEERRLRKRVKRYIRFNRDEDWAKVYDMLLADPVDGRTKAEFIQEMREDSEAIPDEIFFLSFEYSRNRTYVTIDKEFYERVQVSGCAKVKQNGVIHHYWASIGAGRNGTKEWLFTSLPTTHTYSDKGEPLSCR